MESFFYPMVAVILIGQAALVALALWIGYRLVVSAIKRGILEADAERARRVA